MNDTENRNAAEKKEIEALEQQEAEAMLGSDASKLQTLWADDMVVNSTANFIAGKQLLLEMVKNGRLKLRIYERRPVRIQVFSDLVVTTGHEVSQLIGDTAMFKLFTSYMNVWAKRGGNWQLLARHVGLIQRERPTQ
ncbi:MAG: nuclear transport factor 2 family protein [Candidatus Binatus sp.]|uniref:nuclear transport factor 2 family protein n=1 Tax=Candidatus Binatus sp. TaxID=2811406 RepID=UPI003BAF65A3